jgi:hypothetical protein
MSKEVMIGMLKVANNGNDLLTILDSLVENETEQSTTDAVSLQWSTCELLITCKGGQKPPFFMLYT